MSLLLYLSVKIENSVGNQKRLRCRLLNGERNNFSLLAIPLGPKKKEVS